MRRIQPSPSQKIRRALMGMVFWMLPNLAAAQAMLPLDRGYYVAEGTPCGRASHATLQLLRRDGIGGARDFCRFQRIEPAGPNRFRVTQACGDLQGGGPAETITVTYETPNRTSYRLTSTDGWSARARLCPQPSLPAPWRNNDIRDLVR
ncbi:hypothetical protein ACLF3G_05850 [Falsiroseomonas sp. HC035]|uniref:hypothetical protein n=1 Tax=Falsiroseomonas sp. HC035 TaxID=3390999 RepID=UPI003D30FE0E